MSVSVLLPCAASLLPEPSLRAESDGADELGPRSLDSLVLAPPAAAAVSAVLRLDAAITAPTDGPVNAGTRSGAAAPQSVGQLVGVPPDVTAFSPRHYNGAPAFLFTVTGAIADTVARTIADTVTRTVADTATHASTDIVVGTFADTVARTIADTVADTAADTVTRTTADTVAATIAETVTRAAADTVAGATADTTTTADTIARASTRADALHYCDLSPHA